MTSRGMSEAARARWPRRVRVLALFISSLLFSVLAGELVVRAFVPVRNVGMDYTTYDPVYGKALKPSFSTVRHTPEFTMRFSTNSLGFRGPEPDAPLDHPILFLGDSFTEGYGVDDGEEYPDLVRRALAAAGDRVPVVNAGLENNGNGRWLKFLRNEGDRLDPCLIVLQLMKNDFRDNVYERLFELDERGDLVELPVQPPGIVRRLKSSVVERVPGLSSSHLVGLLGQTLTTIRMRRAGFDPMQADSIDTVQASDRLTFRLLDACLDLCERRGWPVLGLIVGVDGERRAALERAFESRSLPTAYVHDWNDRPNLYYASDRHWNVEGHRLAARRVLDRLSDLGFSTSREHVWR